MEKHAPGGSAKCKLTKDKEGRDGALVKEIPSISTFFTHATEANTCTACSSSQGDGSDEFGNGGAALPPPEPAVDANASTASSGSDRGW